MKTKLVRTRTRGMVHVSYCRYAKNAVPWNWAEDKTPIEIITHSAFTGVQFCNYCNPLRQK